MKTQSVQAGRQPAATYIMLQDLLYGIVYMENSTTMVKERLATGYRVFQPHIYNMAQHMLAADCITETGLRGAVLDSGCCQHWAAVHNDYAQQRPLVHTLLISSLSTAWALRLLLYGPEHALGRCQSKLFFCEQQLPSCKSVLVTSYQHLLLQLLTLA